MAKKSSNDIISMMGDWFAKAPSLPKNIQDTLAKIAPILALIFGIIGILGALGGLGLLTIFSPFAMMEGMHGYGYGTGFIAAALWLVSSIFMLVAYPGLRARKMKGWTMLFWSEAISFVGSLVSLAIVSGIIGAVIAFYLLYQIKSYYK